MLFYSILPRSNPPWSSILYSAILSTLLQPALCGSAVEKRFHGSFAKVMGSSRHSGVYTKRFNVSLSFHTISTQSSVPWPRADCHREKENAMGGSSSISKNPPVVDNAWNRDVISDIEYRKITQSKDLCLLWQRETLLINVLNTSCGKALVC